jgi:hypothetical protein
MHRDSHAEAQRRRDSICFYGGASAPWREVLFGLIVVLILGCAGGDGAADVMGEVTLDGQPLGDGVIHFFPTDGQSRTASAFVREGTFQTRVPIGKQRVEISSVQSRPLRPGQAADSASGAEIVPARYNAKSELTADVTKGTNKVRFELTGK